MASIIVADKKKKGQYNIIFHQKFLNLNRHQLELYFIHRHKIKINQTTKLNIKLSMVLLIIY